MHTVKTQQTWWDYFCRAVDENYVQKLGPIQKVYKSSFVAADQVAGGRRVMGCRLTGAVSWL